MAKTTLPGDIYSECGRVAAELMRRQTWDVAGELRKECERWLREGRTTDDVKAELFERMKQAIVEQGRRK